MSPSNRQNPARFTLGALVLAFCLCLSVYAQELDFPVSPTPVGSGARAAGMADAFVAIADDATAASWNPAGLVQLELPELSIVGSYNAISEKLLALYHGEFTSEHSDSNLDLNYASIVYPLPFTVADKNVTLALNYQRKYDMSRNFDTQFDFLGLAGSGVFFSPLRTRFKQSGGLGTITPAVAFELTHTLSLGVAFNFWRSSPLGDNSWEQTTKFSGPLFFGDVIALSERELTEEYEDFEGENFTLGLLWNFRPKWNFGIRYDTAFTGEVDYTRLSKRLDVGLPPLAFVPAVNWPPDFRERRWVRFPDSLALGLAYRASDRLTLSMDVTRTDWNDFWVKDGLGRKFSLVDNSLLNGVRNPLFQRAKTHMDPTYTVRLGAEYVFVPKQPEEELPRLWTLRGGVFYDEEPATGRNMETPFTQLFEGSGEADPFYGFSVGLGLLIKQRINIDIAYQARIGKGVNSDFFRGIPGFEEDVVQHRVLFSTVVYLDRLFGRGQGK